MSYEYVYSVLRDLYKISGLRVSLHGKDFEEVAACPTEKLPFCEAIQESPREYLKCLDCDYEACRQVCKTGKAFKYKCRHGLVEVIAPLYNFGTLTGYLMMGQVGDETLDREALYNALYENLGDEKRARELSESVQTLSEELLNSFVRIMTVCAEYMTLTNVMPSNAPKIPELTKVYVHEHIADRITIKDICKALGCSKSNLLSTFKRETGITINTYINDVKTDEACKLLTTTSFSMGEIADATGFYDQSYFSKVFTSKLGITPSEYRKRYKK